MTASSNLAFTTADHAIRQSAEAEEVCESEDRGLHISWP